MLAIVVAIASISTTPGLVSAVKKSTNKTEKQKVLKKGRGRKKKRKAHGSEIGKKETDDENFEIEDKSCTIEDLIEYEKVNDLKKGHHIFTRSQAKKSESEMDLENIVSTMDILTKCAEDENAFENVSKAILASTKTGFFKDRPKEELLKAIDALKMCVGNDLAKERAVSSIEILTNGGCFEGWDKDEILSILEVLTRCAERGDLAPRITKVVRLLDETLEFKSFGNAAFREFLQSPMRFSKNQEAANVVAMAVALSLPTIGVRSKKLRNMPKEVDNKTVVDDAKNDKMKADDVKDDDEDVIMKDSDKKEEVAFKKADDEKIVAHILDLQKNGEFEKMQRNEIQTIAQSLERCLRSKEKTDEQRVQIIIDLAKEKCFKHWTLLQLNLICEILKKCVDENDDLKQMVVDAVSELGKGQFVNVNFNETFKTLLNILLTNCEQHDTNINLSNMINFIKANYININAYGKGKLILDGKQIEKVIELIQKGLRAQNSKKSASYLFAQFALFLDKDLFNINSKSLGRNASREQKLSQIKSDIFSFIKTETASSKNFDKESVAFIIEAMICKLSLTSEEIATVMEILEKYFEDSSLRERAWDLVFSLKACQSLTKELFLKIFSMWEKYDKVSELENNFQDIKKFLEPDKRNSLNDEDVKMLVRFLSKIFKRPFMSDKPWSILPVQYVDVFNTIFELCKTRQMYDLFKVELLETFELLKNFVSVRGTKRLIVGLVGLPISDLLKGSDRSDVLANWKKEEIEKMLEMLKLCRSNLRRSSSPADLYEDIDKFSKTIRDYIAKVENLSAQKNTSEGYRPIFAVSKFPLSKKINDAKPNGNSKDEIITKTLESLLGRLKQGNADVNILNSALKLFEDCYDQNTPKEKIADLLEIFKQCLQIPGSDKCILDVISKLLSDGYFKDWLKKDGLLKVADMLFECSKNTANLSKIMSIVLDMVCKGYLEGSSQEELLEIFRPFKKAPKEEILKILMLFKNIQKDNIFKIMDYIRESS